MDSELKLTESNGNLFTFVSKNETIKNVIIELILIVNLVFSVMAYQN